MRAALAILLVTLAPAAIASGVSFANESGRCGLAPIHPLVDARCRAAHEADASFACPEEGACTLAVRGSAGGWHAAPQPLRLASHIIDFGGYEGYGTFPTRTQLCVDETIGTDVECAFAGDVAFALEPGECVDISMSTSMQEGLFLVPTSAQQWMLACNDGAGGTLALSDGP